jgi:predicted DNA-binding ribbon-helix-helix protein
MKRHPHRGVVIAGHPTSLRLEPEFWDFLREIAYERQLSLSELINAISQAKSREVTLASALRVFKRSITARLRPKGAEQHDALPGPLLQLPTVEQMPKPRPLKKDAEIAVIPGNPLVLRGARNVRTLSAAFIADLQEDWEKYGTQILELMREKFPDLYFASIVKLAQIVRIEADVSLKEPKPKTIEEVLQRVEHATGVEGRRAFEGFLKKMDKTKEEQGDK